VSGIIHKGINTIQNNTVVILAMFISLVLFKPTQSNCVLLELNNILVMNPPPIKIRITNVMYNRIPNTRNICIIILQIIDY
jgi:hypothetical protein